MAHPDGTYFVTEGIGVKISVIKWYVFCVYCTIHFDMCKRSSMSVFE